MARSAFEEAIANRFRLDRAPTLLAQHSAISPISFTRLRNRGSVPWPHLGGTAGRGVLLPRHPWRPCPQEKSGSTGNMGNCNPRVGRHIRLRPDREQDRQPGPAYDLLRFYLPTATLDELASDRGVRRVGGLRTTQIASQDPVMHGLALSLLPRAPRAGPRDDPVPRFDRAGIPCPCVARLWRCTRKSGEGPLWTCPLAASARLRLYRSPSRWRSVDCRCCSRVPLIRKPFFPRVPAHYRDAAASMADQKARRTR